MTSHQDISGDHSIREHLFPSERKSEPEPSNTTLQKVVSGFTYLMIAAMLFCAACALVSQRQQLVENVDSGNGSQRPAEQIAGESNR